MVIAYHASTKQIQFFMGQKRKTFWIFVGGNEVSVYLNATNVQELCRKNKVRYYPEKTNQVICDNTGLSESAVNNFMRGASGKNVGLNTAGLICREYGVSLDAFFGISPAEREPDAATVELRDNLAQAGADNATLHAKIESLTTQLAHTKQLCRIYKRVETAFGVLVALALIALIVDLLNPNVGWIRQALHISMQWLWL